MEEKEKYYDAIIITESNAFGIWESGKLIPKGLKDRGKYWDIYYLSSLSPEYKDAHKKMVKKTYPNTSVMFLTDKRISNIKKIYIDAVKEYDEKIYNSWETGTGVDIPKNIYFISVDEPTTIIETIKVNESNGKI